MHRKKKKKIFNNQNKKKHLEFSRNKHPEFLKIEASHDFRYKENQRNQEILKGSSKAFPFSKELWRLLHNGLKI